MEKKVSLEDATVTITLEVDGQVHLVAMHPERLEALGNLIKAAAEEIIPTGIRQRQLQLFLLKNQTK